LVILNLISFFPSQKFVDEHFEAEGTELENWLPEDWTAEPEFISTLRKPALKGLARRINRLWKDLSRKIKDEVKEDPSLYSIIYVPNGFIVPGGELPLAVGITKSLNNYHIV
jgi:alpha,alpha-trehalase